MRDKPTPPQYQGYNASHKGRRDFSAGRGPGSDKGPDAWDQEHVSEDREFLETSYRHFNALAAMYKKRLDKIDEK